MDGSFRFRLLRLRLLSLRLSIDHFPFFVESVPRKFRVLPLLLLLPLFLLLLLFSRLAGRFLFLLLLGCS